MTLLERDTEQVKRVNEHLMEIGLVMWKEGSGCW